MAFKYLKEKIHKKKEMMEKNMKDYQINIKGLKNSYLKNLIQINVKKKLKDFQIFRYIIKKIYTKLILNQIYQIYTKIKIL
jgi:hypothetical protein